VTFLADISFVERKYYRLAIVTLVLAMGASIRSTETAELTTKYQTPKLPANPFNYKITTLPDHLISPLTGSNLASAEFSPQYNHRVTLGRVLFYDKSLSQNNLVSCSSCHKQDNGFDDTSRFSIGFKGKITARNSMGLTNAAFNHNGRYFWDERAGSLEDQVMMPIFDPVEMGLNKTELLARIREKPYYSKLFKNAFGDQIISEQKVASALAGFIRSLISFNTFYDKARIRVSNPQDPFPSFSAEQNHGKSIFFKSIESGGAGCINCHVTESFVSLPVGSNNGLNKTTTSDQGTGAKNGNVDDLGKFRPPSLRNISIRAPFMHDGRFETLEEVIDHYSTGIKDHPNLGSALKDETGKPRQFKFTGAEKNALVSFLQTLSDPQIRYHAKYSDPFNN
jgi:cytochrome c peroxidase